MTNRRNLNYTRRNTKLVKDTNISNISRKFQTINHYKNKLSDLSTYRENINSSFGVEVNTHTDIASLFRYRFEPNSLQVDINNYNNWGTNETNHLLSVVNNISTFKSHTQFTKNIYVIFDKTMKEQTVQTSSIENKLVFEEYVRNERTTKRALIKIHSTNLSVPLKIENEYYTDILSSMNLYSTSDINLDFESLYGETIKYRFKLHKSYDIDRLKFKYRDLYIYVDYISEVKDFRTISINVFFDEYTDDVISTTLEQISEFVSILRSNSTIPFAYIREMFKNDITFVDNRSVVYYKDPITEPEKILYENLYLSNSFNSRSLEIAASYNGVYAVLLVSDELFMISLQYSAYFMRYYSLSELESSALPSLSYNAYRVLIYSDDGEDVVNRFMSSLNNERGDKSINILILENLYSYQSGIITSNRTTSISSLSKLPLDLIEQYGYSIEIIQLDKVQEILQNTTLYEYYTQAKSRDSKISSLLLYSNIEGIFYTISEEEIFNLIIDNTGAVELASASKIVERYNKYERDVQIKDLYGDELGTILSDSNITYFVFSTTKSRILRISTHLSRRKAISEWKDESHFLVIEDLNYSNLTLYYKYLAQIQRNILSKYSDVVYIHINPLEVISNDDVNIVIDPLSKNLHYSNYKIVKRYNEFKLESVRELISEYSSKYMIMFVHNIYDAKYNSLVKMILTSGYLDNLVIVDLVVSDLFYTYNSQSHKWNSEIKSRLFTNNNVEIINQNYTLRFTAGGMLDIRDTSNKYARNITTLSSLVSTNDLVKTYYNLFQHEDVDLSSSIVDNVIKLLISNIRVVSTTNSSNTVTINSISESGVFQVIYNNKNLKFKIDTSHSFVDGFLLALDLKLNVDLLVEELDRVAKFKNIDTRFRNLTTQSIKIDHLNFISSMFKIEIVIFDISKGDIYMRTQKYSNLIYYITDGTVIHPLIYKDMRLSHFDS